MTESMHVLLAGITGLQGEQGFPVGARDVDRINTALLKGERATWRFGGTIYSVDGTRVVWFSLREFKPYDDIDQKVKDALSKFRT